MDKSYENENFSRSGLFKVRHSDDDSKKCQFLLKKLDTKFRFCIFIYISSMTAHNFYAHNSVIGVDIFDDW